MSTSRFEVSWDGTSTSGMQSYDVYVSKEGGTWMPWLTGTQNASAYFNADPFTSYAFYALGTNNVGVSSLHSPSTQTSTFAGINAIDLIMAETANEKPQLCWNAFDGCVYQLQSSSNLVTWLDLGSNQSTAQSSELLTYIDDSYDYLSNKFTG